MKADVGKLPPELVNFIDECACADRSESYLIPVLQRIQEQFGYLSREHMDEVSQRMRIPAAKVTGVATFYHFFTFTPRGRHTITVCMGTACFVRGAGKLVERLSALLGVAVGGTTPDGLFSLESARCLGTCALAPVVVVDEKVYGNVAAADLEGILREHGYGDTEARAPRARTAGA